MFPAAARAETWPWWQLGQGGAGGSWHVRRPPEPWSSPPARGHWAPRRDGRRRGAHRPQADWTRAPFPRDRAQAAGSGPVSLSHRGQHQPAGPGPGACAGVICEASAGRGCRRAGSQPGPGRKDASQAALRGLPRGRREQGPQDCGDTSLVANRGCWRPATSGKAPVAGGSVPLEPVTSLVSCQTPGKAGPHLFLTSLPGWPPGSAALLRPCQSLPSCGQTLRPPPQVCAQVPP